MKALFINAVCAGTPDNAVCDFTMAVQVLGGPTVPQIQRANEVGRFIGLVFEHVVTTGHDVFLTGARER